MKTLLALAAVTALAGCSAIQAFGEAARDLQEYERQNPPAPTKQYFPTPAIQPPSNQVNIKPDAGGYQLIMVNTPNGWVQKRCYVINGKAAHCL